MADSPSSIYQTTTYSIDDPDGRERWNQLRNRTPQTSPFDTLAYATALTYHMGVDARYWILSDETQDLAGLLVFSKKQGPFSRAIVPGFTPFNPLISIHGLPSPAPLLKLLENVSATFDDLRLHFPPSYADTRPLKLLGWQTQIFHTYLIDLESYDIARTSWSESTRRNYKKNVDDFAFRQDESALDACLALCVEGYKRNGRIFPVAPQQLRSVASALRKKGMIQTFVVSSEKDAEPEAGVVVLHDGKTACYWIAGSVPGPAMTVLIGRLLEHLKASNFELFDFIGANTPGIAEFKRRFGPVLTPYAAGMITPHFMLKTLLKLKRKLS